jgi:hypothetical protein
VDAFLDDLAGLLESAEAGESATDLTILVGNHGVEMLSNVPGPLEAIRVQNGARAAYRIIRRAGRVQVEGAAAGRTASLSSGARPRLPFSHFPASLLLPSPVAAVAN